MTSLPVEPAYAIDPFPLNDNFGPAFSDKLAREPLRTGRGAPTAHQSKRLFQHPDLMSNDARSI